MRTPTPYKEIPGITMPDCIQSVALAYIFLALMDYILDPFSQLDGSDIDG